MRLTKLRLITGGALTLAAAMMTTSVKADLTYDWVPDSGKNAVSSSGYVTVNSLGDVTAIKFVDGSFGTFTYTGTGSFLPLTEVLSDGDLAISADVWENSSDINKKLGVKFIDFELQVDSLGNPVLGADEINVEDNYDLQGKFVPVPEPSTVMAGALLVLPFGASTLRILRKNRAA